MKNIQVRSDDDIFFILSKCTNFKVSRLGIGVFDEFLDLGLKVLTRSRSRRLLSRLHHWGLSSGGLMVRGLEARLKRWVI